MISIKEICSKDYTPLQIKAWGGREFFSGYMAVVDEDCPAWVIKEGSEIHGLCRLTLPKVGDIANISALYIAPSATGRGFGKEFISLAKLTAMKSGFQRMYTDSTKTAKSFYVALGFRQEGPDSHCMVGGVPIEGHPLFLDL